MPLFIAMSDRLYRLAAVVESVMQVTDHRIDHRRLTHRFQGRDFRLTDVVGNLVDPILA